MIIPDSHAGRLTAKWSLSDSSCCAPSLPVLIRGEVHLASCLDHVVQVDGHIKRIVIQSGGTVETGLPLLQHLNIWQEWLAKKRPVWERLHVRDAHVKPLARVPVGHVYRGKKAQPMEIDTPIECGKSLTGNVVQPIRPAAV